MGKQGEDGAKDPAPKKRMILRSLRRKKATTEF